MNINLTERELQFCVNALAEKIEALEAKASRFEQSPRFSTRDKAVLPRMFIQEMNPLLDKLKVYKKGSPQ